MKSQLLGAVGTLGLVLLASCGGSSTSPYGGGGGGGGGSGCTSTATKVCMVAGNMFSPTTLTVPVGTTVTWQNGSSATHTVTSATGSGVAFSSGNIAAGGTFTQMFSVKGTYNYYCMFHGLDGNPPTGMAGKITVQ